MRPGSLSLINGFRLSKETRPDQFGSEYALASLGKYGPTYSDFMHQVELPVNIGITGTVFLHDLSLSANGFEIDHSTALVGWSLDLNIGDKGAFEIGAQGERFGLGVNVDSSGITGFTGHYGWSWPPSYIYGSTSN